MLDCIKLDDIRRTPLEIIEAFKLWIASLRQELNGVYALYAALDRYCKNNSLGYATIERALRKCLEPVVDDMIFTP